MSASLPHLSAAQSENLREELIAYALTHGLVVRPQPSFLADNPGGSVVVHAPVALHPSEFPKQAFDHAKEIQTGYNELYAKIANDEDFMSRIMAELAPVDDFMKKLWELHLTVKARGILQPLSLGLFRSDYLLHSDSDDLLSARIKQVEFNTISSSFASLATLTADMHRNLASRGFYSPGNPEHYNLPENPAMRAMARGLAQGAKAYGGKTPVVMFVVQADERNVFDQRWLSTCLMDNDGIQSYRVAFTDIQQRCSVSADGTLTLQTPDGEVEVSVVYFRAGYGPEDYKSDREWQSRRLLEQSKAIKCPTVITQLAGSKKVQQVLSDSGIVERFIDTQDAAKLRETFVGMHSPDGSPAGQEACKLAMEQPERFVLKPQREGGGNNIYREAIPKFLQSIQRDHWAGFILMELILPPIQHNAIVRQGSIYSASVISELGIYGTILWSKDGTILNNDEAGHLLRTKSRDTDEGGVAAGFACIDSPSLV
ncbi:glutathione synthase [Protomyces lactucae-debilis]|uniref:Glutathione synthetase n=1 Tax=Protomyces lactucae-debilis TaxID=2754530 RepID=A0A1Y2FV08_PROLT|nr:glutathione synthase [Protomyces lactucae-debilis]ORY87840.1 glutathione synthase [Protomyces lactucae-debilis]